jgi:hypothetical protein
VTFPSLESLLLQLKAEKELLVQTPKLKQEIRYLDSDLLKLKSFGNKQPSKNIVEPYERLDMNHLRRKDIID